MRTHFDSSEQRTLLEAARFQIEAAAQGRPAAGLPGELAGEEVFGVFTTLRRGGLLRGCIGHWTLRQDLEQRLGGLLALSAVSSATRDTRFPSIHPAELDFLEVELSILFPPRRIGGRPDALLAEVEPGRHGLILEFHGNRGVLLPQVAADRGWDAGTFLEQICVKAGLPREAWREPKAELKVFEALHFSDPPRRSEIPLEAATAGLPALLDRVLRSPGDSAAELADFPFEIWTGILVEGTAGLQFCIRESGSLALLVEEVRNRRACEGGGDSIRRVSLLSHALPLKGSDEPERRHLLAGGAVWVRSGDGKETLRVSPRRRGGDPVPGALRAAGVSHSGWLQGEASVVAFAVRADG